MGWLDILKKILLEIWKFTGEVIADYVIDAIERDTHGDRVELVEDNSSNGESESGSLLHGAAATEEPVQENSFGRGSEESADSLLQDQTGVEVVQNVQEKLGSEQRDADSGGGSRESGLVPLADYRIFGVAAAVLLFLYAVYTRFNNVDRVRFPRPRTMSLLDCVTPITPSTMLAHRTRQVDVPRQNPR